MRGRSGHDKALPQSGRISALAGRKGRLRACTSNVPQNNSQQRQYVVTSSIIKSDDVPRPSAGGGSAFQGGQVGRGAVEASAALDGG